MKIKAVRSDKVYAKILTAKPEKKEDIYRYELMMPFKSKWDCYHVPIKATTPNGYDVIIASGMLGHLAPKLLDETQHKSIRYISSDELWVSCEQAIRRSLDCFTMQGTKLPVEEYLFTLLLADPKNPYTILNDGYCGDGGIPGYILAWLTPNQYTLDRLAVTLAHEVNHNVRFQFIKWRNDITLGEMVVNEGLAESFATSLYGEEMAGPWVTKTDLETLDGYIKPIIYDGLNVQGLEGITAYLYGDEMAVMQGYEPVGLPYCAGYACGYHLIKHYLNKTGKGIVEASLLPAKEILEAVEDFWDG